MKVDYTREAEVSTGNETFVRIPTTKEEFGATNTWFLMHCPDSDLAQAFATSFNELAGLVPVGPVSTEYTLD